MDIFLAIEDIEIKTALIKYMPYKYIANELKEYSFPKIIQFINHCINNNLSHLDKSIFLDKISAYSTFIMPIKESVEVIYETYKQYPKVFNEKWADGKISGEQDVKLFNKNISDTLLTLIFKDIKKLSDLDNVINYWNKKDLSFSQRYINAPLNKEVDDGDDDGDVRVKDYDIIFRLMYENKFNKDELINLGNEVDSLKDYIVNDGIEDSFVEKIVTNWLDDYPEEDGYNVDEWFEVLKHYEDWMDMEETMVGLYQQTLNQRDVEKFQKFISLIEKNEIELDIDKFVEEHDGDYPKYYENLYYIWKASGKPEVNNNMSLYSIAKHSDIPEEKEWLAQSLNLEKDDESTNGTYRVYYGEFSELNDYYKADDVFNEDSYERWDRSTDYVDWNDGYNGYSELNIDCIIDIAKILKNDGFVFPDLSLWEEKIEKLRDDYLSKTKEIDWRQSKKRKLIYDEYQDDLKALEDEEFNDMKSKIEDILKEDYDEDHDDYHDSEEDAINDNTGEEIRDAIKLSIADAQASASESEYHNNAINALSDIFSKWNDGSMYKNETPTDGRKGDYNFAFRLNPVLLIDNCSYPQYLASREYNNETFNDVDELIEEWLDQEGKITFNDDVYGSIDNSDVIDRFSDHISQHLPSEETNESIIIKFKDFK